MSSGPSPARPAAAEPLPVGGATRLLYAGLAIWSWVALGLLVLLGCIVQAVVLLFTFPFDRTRRISGRLVRLTGVAIAKAIPFWRFSVARPLPAYRPRRTVCVSNHLSQTDTFLISHLPWEMKWLAKASAFRIPFIGWAVWLAGDIPVVRGDPASARKAMARCARYLEREMPVMIFPEGTRSRDGKMLPFKDGAFRLAIETGADVLPLAVAGSRAALPKGSWKPGFANGRVAVGSPIATSGMTLDDVARLKAEAQAQIEAMSSALRASTTA
jgi:1-acyl-sn-glycerol-3-phosphate acyltransferase